MNFPRLFLFTTNGGSRIRAHKRRRQRDALARMSQREAVPFCGESQVVAGAAREKPRFGGCLSTILFKRE